MELNILKKKALEGRDQEWLDKQQKKVDEAIKRDHEAAVKRMNAANENVAFIKKQ